MFGAKSTSSVVSIVLHLNFGGKVSSLNLQLADLVSLASQPVLEIHCSLPPQHRGYKAHDAVTGCCMGLQAHDAVTGCCMGAGTQNVALPACTTSSSPTNLSPYFSSFLLSFALSPSS